MRKRRTVQRLTRAIEQARTNDERAGAYYHLAVFHDNNSRETEAIPNYERALDLGLDQKTRVEALAWLASSLYKTGRLQEAARRAGEAETLVEDQRLRSFLLGLQRRIVTASRRTRR